MSQSLDDGSAGAGAFELPKLITLVGFAELFAAGHDGAPAAVQLLVAGYWVNTPGESGALLLCCCIHCPFDFAAEWA